MAATPAPQAADSPAAVLAAVRAARVAADREEARILALALDWAAMHPPESRTDAAGWPGTRATVGTGESGALGGERMLPLAGPGAPQVTEFCIAELAAALRISTDAGRSLLAEAIELGHRLPEVWRRVRAGDLPAWRARRIARATITLPRDGAGFVDRQLAPFAHRVGLAQLDRLVEEALVRFDPDRAATRRAAAADGRHLHVHLDQVGYEGTVHVQGELDLADALDLDTALTHGAATLAALGSPDPLDVRRAHALGELARGTHPQLPLTDPTTNTTDTTARADNAAGATGAGPGPAVADPGPSGPPRRQVVLHVHLSRAALGEPPGTEPAQDTPGAGGAGLQLARVENTRSFVDADQVRGWCRAPGTTITVRPVLDLADHHAATGYETPDRLAEQATHVDDTCVFPWCTRPARTSDCDHIHPHTDGGPTCSCNIARLCRRHHRLKTHTAWHYTPLEPGTYLWTSPHRYQFLRDRTGTLDVTPTHRPHPTGHRHLLPLPDP